MTAMTSAGAIKQLIEGGGLSLAAYRDDAPKLTEQPLPYVTIDEGVAVSTELHGDTGDPNGHHGESEQLTVHLWQAWRTDDGKPAENYQLPRKLTTLLRTARPFAYGPDDAPVRVYGIRISGRARLVEDEANIVHHAITCTLRRDA
jgi:hypothetical protein